jgi:hypothetical protein
MSPRQSRMPASYHLVFNRPPLRRASDQLVAICVWGYVEHEAPPIIPGCRDDDPLARARKGHLTRVAVQRFGLSRSAVRQALNAETDRISRVPDASRANDEWSFVQRRAM